MRVLHFADNFLQPTETFIKRYVQKSRQFAATGVVAFNLIDITNEYDGISFFEIKNRLYTRKTPGGLVRFISEYASGIHKWHQDLADILKEFKPDIIHCHFGVNGVIWMNFERKFKTGIPFATSFYGYDASSLPFKDPSYRKQLNKLWQHGTAFFAEGPELVKKLIKLGAPTNKCMVNPLLIPTDDYLRKANYRVPGEPIKFLFIGRFMEKKGFHLFLNALGKLKSQIEEFYVDIIGSGPYKGVYEQIINAHDLNQNINWLGMKKHQEVLEMIGAYDFFVHPSLTASDNDSEGGAPTIIIEAQAAGLPVITSNHADIPYVMGYDDFIAKENDIDSLIGVIKKIINCNNIRHYADQGIAKVQLQHNFSTSSIYENNLNVLNSHN